MNRLIRTSAIIATIAVVLSVSSGFAPQADAGTPPSLGIDLILTETCGFNLISASVAMSTVTPPNPSTGTFSYENTGTGTQPISFDVGDSATGGIGDNVGTHILPIDIDIDAIVMESTGIPQFVTNLVAGAGATVSTMTAQTDNLVNLPATGAQTGTLTATLGTCT